MKIFKIRVNGHEYEVEVEEVTSDAANAPAKPRQVPAAQPARQEVQRKSAPTVPTAPAASVQEGTTTILAPMPGTIVDVQVSPGERVSKGQTLMILEAMKMENEILAPHDCTIGQSHVAKGASVNAGDVLVTLS